ncbi:MAG: thymidine phosphorylase [Kiritimatiellae bacterium]|nr:thymidine phosphorylase [Kiritimatiellia bacterium]
MVPQWFIEAKRDGKAHSEGDLRTWIHAVTDGSLPDYQISAWLMAVYLNGMTDEEIAILTDAMLHSGETITFQLDRPTVDKHSTGGIGDKISIPLAPLCAAMGMAVPMISGRGLGITGGTLDKLESISGFNVRLPIPAFKRLTDSVGCCMIGQTDTLAPADRRLYALRDVTGTVPSIPLITASIMSKKLAEGAETLLFDVKFGSGAFMKTQAAAKDLAHHLIQTGERLGRKCRALITDMNQPLGRTVGNALEVRESLAILAGDGPEDVRQLTLAEAAHLAHASGLCQTLAAAEDLAKVTLDSGKAMAKFREMCEAQGGDPDAPLPKATHCETIVALESGTVEWVDAEKIGRAALILGAGRLTVSASPDLAVGIDELVQQGEPIAAGAPLCRLHANRLECIEPARQLVQEAIRITQSPVMPRSLITEVLSC